MEDLLKDLRYAARMLVRKPGFLLVTVLSLALGIGANTTIFTLIDALLLRPLPVAEPERLVAVFGRDVKNPGFNPISHLNWKDYREQNKVFSGLLGYDWVAMSVATGGGEPALALGQMVSGDYFDLLGIKAAQGRTFTRGEDGTPGAHPVAVVSHSFWQERLGGDPAAVGRTIRVNGSPFTVVGVAPEGFTGPSIGVQPAVWVPMAMNKALRSNPDLNWYETRRGLFIFAVGRLQPGMTLARARSEMGAIAKRLERDYPTDNKGRSVELLPLPQATLPPQLRAGLVNASTLLMSVVGLVLLIACANVANLLLARASARRREIAIRLSQGAGRGRLVRQLLTESVLLSLLGGAVGLLIVVWARRALLAFLPSLPFAANLQIDLRISPAVLAFTLGVSLVTGILFGLVPALQGSRPELVSALKSAAAPQTGRRRFSTRGALVAAQVALSLVSLIAAGLFLRSLGQARQTDPGYDPHHLMVMSFDVGLQGLAPQQGEQLFRDVRERVESVPGVASAAVAQAGPFQGTFMRSVFLEGREAATDGTLVQVNLVGPGYFPTLGVPMVRGRAFDDRDRAGSAPVVVVNETMAKQFWPGADPLGQRFRFFGDESSVEVVGVARDAVYNQVGEDPQPYIYQPLGQRYTSAVTLLARTEGDPAAALTTVQREVRSLVKDTPLVGVATVPQTMSDTLWVPKAGATLLAVFGLLALVLAATGIYGVMSYSVAQRSREIGVRMALGARQGDVLGLVLRQGMMVVAAGFAIGLVLAFAVSRFAAGMLFGISATDPVAFGATPVLLAAIALLASFLPARRAAAVDPNVVLRAD